MWLVVERARAPQAVNSPHHVEGGYLTCAAVSHGLSSGQSECLLRCVDIQLCRRNKWLVVRLAALCACATDRQAYRQPRDAEAAGGGASEKRGEARAHTNEGPANYLARNRLYPGHTRACMHACMHAATHLQPCSPAPDSRLPTQLITRRFVLTPPNRSMDLPPTQPLSTK